MNRVLRTPLAGLMVSACLMLGLSLPATSQAQAREGGRGRTSGSVQTDPRPSGSTRSREDKAGARKGRKERAGRDDHGRRSKETRKKVEKRERHRDHDAQRRIVIKEKKRYDRPEPGHHYRPGYGPKHRPHHHPVHIRVDVHWPWEARYKRMWRPRYRYRQVVHLDVRWGRRYRQSRIEVQTYYRHEVRYATSRYAVVDLTIEEVELFHNGRFIGGVHHIPNRLRHLTARIYRDGRVSFDRDVFIVGDPSVGFEMIAASEHRGFVLDTYGPAYEVGRLDLRRGRVHRVDRSRLFDPYAFDGWVPVSLLPEDPSWLYDYGPGAISAYEDDYDYYGYQAPEPGVSLEAGLTFHREKTSRPHTGKERRSLATRFGARVQVQQEREIQRLR